VKRDMEPVPAPRQAGSLAARGSGALDKRPPGSIEYVQAEGVGFELLPELIHRSVASALIGDEIAADAEPPEARRRRDGSHYQFASGWWASAERLVVIEGRRDLERRGGNRFAPAAAWSVSMAVREFPPVSSPKSRVGISMGRPDRPMELARQKPLRCLMFSHRRWPLQSELVSPVPGNDTGAGGRLRRSWHCG
jgi:hypothetical protein